MEAEALTQHHSGSITPSSRKCPLGLHPCPLSASRHCRALWGAQPPQAVQEMPFGDSKLGTKCPWEQVECPRVVPEALLEASLSRLSLCRGLQLQPSSNPCL